MRPTCVACGHSVEAATMLGSGGDLPNDGDVSVCLYCGHVAIFTGQGVEIREPTDEEREYIESNAEVQAAVALVAVARDGVFE